MRESFPVVRLSPVQFGAVGAVPSFALLVCRPVFVPRQRACSNFLLVAVASLFVASSCTSWHGEAVYEPPRSHRDRQATFAVGLPGDNWKPFSDRKNKDLQVAWRHAEDASVIQVRSQCEEHGDSSLEMFIDHLSIDFDSWKIIEADAGRAGLGGDGKLVGRNARRARVAAVLDGVEVMMALVVLKKDGCLFDLSYISSPQQFDAHLAEFERVIAGFRFPLG